jgi:transposase
MPPSRQFGTEISGNRRKGPNLTPEQRLCIISKREAGVSIAELVEEFGRSKRAIKYTIKTYAHLSTTKDKPRSGRPPMLSPRQKKILLRKARGAPKIEYAELAKAVQVVLPEDTPSKLPSKSTLYRELKRQRITNYRCKKRPLLTRARARKRVLFCRAYRHHN